MAISIKGKGKAFAISLVVTALLMMAGGSLSAVFIGGNGPGYVAMVIGGCYGVWFYKYFNKEPDKPV
jgi:hypothetical protein